MGKRKVEKIVDDICHVVGSKGQEVGAVMPSGRLMSKVVKFGETYLRVYSIGHLAMALDRSAATIRRWQRNKVIPRPIIATRDGARWYLKEEIVVYSRLVKTYDVRTGLSIEKTGFKEAIFTEIDILKKRVTNTVKK